MDKMKDVALLVGRVLLALMFVMAGWGKIGGYAGTQGYMEAMGVPGFMLPLVILLELGGGLAIMLGLFTRSLSVLLAAKYDSLVQVITGTTLGMMLANVPVVLIGKLGADKLPLKGIRIACAILFVGLGVSTLIFA